LYLLPCYLKLPKNHYTTPCIRITGNWDFGYLWVTGNKSDFAYFLRCNPLHFSTQFCFPQFEYLQIAKLAGLVLQWFLCFATQSKYLILPSANKKVCWCGLRGKVVLTLNFSPKQALKRLVCVCE